MSTITPTIGRKVWYYPSSNDLNQNQSHPMLQFAPHDGVLQPFDADVVYVWNERGVNLVVKDHDGGVHVRRSVRLLQGNDTAGPDEAHAAWMPYQRGQAARTDAAEQRRVVLTDADVAADLAGTPRPDNPSRPAIGVSSAKVPA
jgi:hypothetical protein